MPAAIAEDALFTPTTLGALKLSHRVAFAPMTRNRTIPSEKNPGTWTACPLMCEYYEQRTTPGALMISEAIPVSRQASDGAAPGIYTEEQIEAWGLVVNAVHAAGGVFVAQLWHQGRTVSGHREGLPMISASAVRVEEPLKGPPGDIPMAMTLEDIKTVKEEYAQAARNCIKAGFDGVEIHGANGYLPDQFLHSNVNRRTDQYGGSMENRNRFVIELSRTVAATIGPNRFGLRLAPFGFFNETRGEKRVEQWTMLCEAVKDEGWAYVHFMEPRYDEMRSGGQKMMELGVGEIDLAPFKKALGPDVPVIVAGGYDAVNAPGVIAEGKADVIAFGRYFTSNPDLVYRLQQGKPLVRYIRPRFYGPFPDPEVGYTDFPFCDDLTNTEKRKALLKTSTAKTLQIAEPGWQLSSNGIQLGGLFKPVVAD